jgi:curved DNA-binding protein CbpA
LYERIGLQPEASDSEIKKAYRKLSVQYHPDKNKGNAEAEQKFREITEAYEILGDKEKRVIYDSSGIGAVRKMVRRRRRRRCRPPARPSARPPARGAAAEAATLPPCSLLAARVSAHAKRHTWQLFRARPSTGRMHACMLVWMPQGQGIAMTADGPR